MDRNKKRRRSKPEQDGSDIFRPKRFLTAYNFFFKHERAACLEAQSDSPKEAKCQKKEFSNHSKMIASKWKNLTPKERKVYEDMANKDLARYQREVTEHRKKMAEEKAAGIVVEKGSESPPKKTAKQQRSTKTKREQAVPKKEQAAPEKEKPLTDQAKSDPISDSKSSFSNKIPSVASMQVDTDNQLLHSINPTKIVPYLGRACQPEPKERFVVDETLSAPQAKENTKKGEPEIKQKPCHNQTMTVTQAKKDDLPRLAYHDSICNEKRDRKIGSFVFQMKKLYGRDAHMATIMNSYRKVSQSKKASEVVLVSGYSGAGKSALVQQAQKTITDMGANFLSGKFEHFRQMEPLSAIILAFTELCNEIATRDAEKLRQTRSAIQEKVGSEVAFLANIIPCLSQIIQIPTPETVHIGGKESQNRIKYVFQLFVRAIATPSQPLVLFLDDLQWADSLSLDLIESLVIDSENEHFLFIGAYRDNEVTETHPLSAKLRNIESKQVCITQIKVGDLSNTDTNEMISDMLQTPPHLTQYLTNTVYRKTSGNVFCVLQFIGIICDEGLLSFSLESKQWQWDTTTIESKNIAENIVGLMLRKILQLPKATQSALKLMACIGYCVEEFILSLIAAAHDISNFDCTNLMASLQVAAKEGLVDHVGSSYKFAHDQIQFATYSLIPESERGNWHFWIGSQVWANKSASPDKALFIAVGQLNKGAALIKDNHQRIEIAGLNLEAAQKSKSLAAFEPAAFYLNTAISLLDNRSWVDHYDLCLKLYSSCAEAEYCIGHFDEMNKKLEKVFSNARCLDDELDSFLTLVEALNAQNKVQKALDVGLLVLSQLGESFPAFSDMKSIVMVEFTKAQQMIEGKTDDELMAMKTMDDRHKIAAMRFMYILFYVAFQAEREVFALIILRMVQTSLKHGICDESAFGFSGIGMLKHSVFKDIAGAYRFAQLSLRILERTKAKKCLPGVYGCIYVYILPGLDHYRASLGPLEHAYNVGMRCGDVSFAMGCIRQYCMYTFHCGENLTMVETVLRKYDKKMTEQKQVVVQKQNLPYLQAVLNLMGHSDDPEQLTGEVMNQDELLEEIFENKRIRAAAVIYHIRSWLAFIFGNYKLASEMTEKRQAIPLMSAPPFLSCSFLFVEGLVSFEMARKKISTKWDELAQTCMEGMKEYAIHAPSNCQHKLLLLQAESAHLTGELDTAAKRFDDAINVADESGFLQDLALANERAGIFYLKQGNTLMSSRYFGQAHHAYLTWGAKRKADYLLLQYDF